MMMRMMMMLIMTVMMMMMTMMMMIFVKVCAPGCNCRDMGHQHSECQSSSLLIKSSLTFASLTSTQ